MEYRQLGRSGLRVSVLGLGTAGFGGKGFFYQMGSTDVASAKRQIDICLDAGVNYVDSSDVYSAGLSEEILGEAIRGRRDEVIVATKVRYPLDAHEDNHSTDPNNAGLSRHHLIRACEGSLKRLGIDHIDLCQVHGWDGVTPLEETMEAFDSLVRSGKVRYIGCSNFCGWQLMKSLWVSDKHGFQRYISQQIFYSLQAREAEYELVPIGLDQGVGVICWSPLAGGLLSGKFRRNQPPPTGYSRQLTEMGEPPVRDLDQLYDIVETLVEIAEARNSTPAQVALSYLLAKPGVSSVLIGARSEEQLVSNLGATALELSAEETERLNQVSAVPLIYPYWHQLASSDRLGVPELSILGPALEKGKGKSYRQVLDSQREAEAVRS